MPLANASRTVGGRTVRGSCYAACGPGGRPLRRGPFQAGTRAPGTDKRRVRCGVRPGAGRAGRRAASFARLPRWSGRAERPNTGCIQFRIHIQIMMLLAAHAFCGRLPSQGTPFSRRLPSQGDSLLKETPFSRRLPSQGETEC